VHARDKRGHEDLDPREKDDRSCLMRRLLVAVAVLVLIGIAIFWFVTAPQTVPANALGPHEANLENGRAMFLAGGCASCHASPNQEDRTRLGGGMALKTPFGTFYPPNISPNPKDGIGGWSEANFVTAMWKGTAPDGSHYYPVFPYTSYQRMQLDDVRDLFAFIKTLPAVAGKTREHDLPIYLGARRMLGGWKFLFLDGQRFKPDPAQPGQRNRGAYLVNGPGHCAECHSPRNLFGAIIERQRFAGGPDPEGGEGSVPNITQAGIGDYSLGDIEQVLATGDTPSGDSVGGPMRDVVRNSRELKPEDRKAMADYLKSLPPVEGQKPPERK
jgi:mono/diheme cytochrome c family protein